MNDGWATTLNKKDRNNTQMQLYKAIAVFLIDYESEF
jgi:hypothetical protein